MKNKYGLMLIAALAATPATLAFAASGDTPAGPNGVTGAPPREAANAVVTPSRGSGGTDIASLTEMGALPAAEASFPPNGMATVAHGKVGKQGESIINWDSRTRGYTTTYPNRAIVFIEYNGSHMCTGWMISANTIATAGHCVHSGGRTGAWYTASKYKIYPGRDGTVSPYGYCTVKWVRSTTGWVSSGDFKFDYGAMRLNCTVGNTVGWFGMYSPATLTNQPAIIAGYPGDKPRTLWTSADKIRYYSTEMLGYRMDTVGGHSGSPIWHDKDEATASNGAWGIGIHNYGVGAFGSNTNAAARLTSTRINNYISWINTP